jgi:predicted enzyme related to lactoylglutathione lyase
MTEGAQPKAHRHGAFCWYECGSRDAAAAEAFYTGLFGWQASANPMPGVEDGVYTILAQDGRDVGGLYELSGPHFEGVPSHWAAYVWTDDVDAVAGQVAGLGGQLLQPPFDVPGVGRMAVVKDPQGAVLHLFRGTDHGGSRAIGTTPGSFCWSELVTPNPQAAGAFYTQLLGWVATAEKMPTGTTYTIFRNEASMVGGMMAMEGEQRQGVPPHWMNYVCVSSTDQAVSRAVELGGKVPVPPTDIADVGRFAVLQDPAGAVFSVIRMMDPEP